MHRNEMYYLEQNEIMDKFSEKLKFRGPKHILRLDNGISGLGKTCFCGGKNSFGVRSMIQVGV